VSWLFEYEQMEPYVKKVRIIIKNEVECVLSGLLPDHLDFFYEEYGVREEGYFFSPRFKLKLWDGKRRFFSKAGKTYVILLEEIIPKVVRLGYKIALDDHRVSPAYDVSSVSEDYFSAAIDPKTERPYEIRPYQVDPINLLLTHGNGIVVAGTGAGKTTINAALVAKYGEHNARSITIVPNQTLIRQTMKWFNFFGLDTGEYSGLHKDLDHQHIVSTWQALKNNPEIIRDFQVLVVDECHGTRAKVLGKLVNEHGQKIAYRFGLTGSMPKDKSQVMAITTSLGPVRFIIPAHELIEQGWLASLNISVMQLDDKKPLIEADVPKGEFIEFGMEMDWLHSNKPRMQWIADFLTEKSIQPLGNVLCLVSSVGFGKKLKKVVPGAYFVFGKDKDKVRQQVYDLFENNDNIIVIATAQVAGVGLSIDRIFNLVYIDLGKSFIRVIQAIGRGLRKGKDKDHVDATDICSNLKHSRGHLTKRLKYYREAKYPNKKYLVEYTE